MSSESVSFVAQTLVVGDKTFQMPYPVADAFAAAAMVIVLFDPDSALSRFGQFRNLTAIDPLTGEQVWVAELPSSTTGDRYYKLASREPLVAYSVKSFVCTIDPTTGKISEKDFVK